MIMINGDAIPGMENCPLAEVLRRQGFDAGRVVVERNRQVVPRRDYAATLLRDGDVLEILHFVGGG